MSGAAGGANAAGSRSAAGGRDAAEHTARAAWRAARVTYNERAAEDMVALGVKPEAWIPHRAGQHYEIRFPGEELSRKFSVVTSPTVAAHNGGELEFGIQLLPNGLLSRRLAASAAGEPLELRGPQGNGFVWTPEHSGPALLIGAGAGITPLLSIYEHRREAAPELPMRFVISAKRPGRIYRYGHYRDVLTTRFTESEPRIDKAFLREALAGLIAEAGTRAWLCAPPGFIDRAVDDLIALGLPETHIRSESYT